MNLNPPAENCSVAFKEWAGVCASIGSGRRSLILRKGGVAEGPGGFRPDHPAFWLYPTFVHEAEQGLRASSEPGTKLVETPGRVDLQTLVVVEWVGRIERLEQLAGLAEFHDWTESTVLGRFHYRTPGLWALAVRAYRRPEPWPVAITPADLGCKTWVPLESPPPASELLAVLNPEETSRFVNQIRSAMAAGVVVETEVG